MSDSRPRYSFERAFAILGALGLIAVLAVIAAIAIGSWRQPPARPAAVAAKDARETLTVSSPDPIARTDIVRLNVYAGRQGNAYSSSGYDDLRNIILLDTRTGENRRLLPDNTRRIVNSHWLPDKASEPVDADRTAIEGLSATDRAPSAVYYVLIVDMGDAGDALLIGRLAGGAPATIMAGLDGVDGVWTIDPTHVATVVRQNRHLFYRVIDTTKPAVSLSKPVAVDQ